MGLQLFSRLRCPICHDVLGDVTKVIPCGHQFCLGCIMLLAEQVAECPLCRKPIENVTFSNFGRLENVVFGELPSIGECGLWRRTSVNW
uniref:RING-type domain-containing protein n=1 Tax=Amazona collaria TaxID=241587 RepID=A0A8B9FD78_9PSIT